MDPWLTDQVKELLFRPCLETSGHVGRRLSNRVRQGQSIDERALTEDFVDLFDSNSNSNAWGTCITELREHQVYLSTSVRKSTQEHRTGTDIGLVLRRSLHGPLGSSTATYACLIQCKKVDHQGTVTDFYHRVGPQKVKQSSLMLDVTSSSFYFLFIPPVLVQHYCTIEPLAFLRGAPDCSVPVWNLGSFAIDGPFIPFLTTKNKEDVTGILVVPALAVEAQQASGTAASLRDLLPNSLPLWYWFGQLFVPGFVGDRDDRTVKIAMNTMREDTATDLPFGVRFLIEMSLSNG